MRPEPQDTQNFIQRHWKDIRGLAATGYFITWVVFLFFAAVENPPLWAVIPAIGMIAAPVCVAFIIWLFLLTSGRLA